MLDGEDSDEAPEVVPSKKKQELPLKKANGAHKRSESRVIFFAVRLEEKRILLMKIFQEKRRSTESESAPVTPDDNFAAPPDKKRRIAHSTKLGFLPPKPNKKVIRPVISSVGQVS